MSLLFFAAQMGVTISTFGALSNVWVVRGSDSDMRGKNLCALHAMYGVGSLIASTSCAILLGWGVAWPYFFSALIPALFILLLLLNKTSALGNYDKATIQPIKISPYQIFIVLAFSIYVAAEVMASMWMVTFIVETRHLSVAQANRFSAVFFFLMAASRAGAYYVKIQHERLVLILSSILALVFFGVGHLGVVACIPLAGVMGPYFPLLLARVSRKYPEQWRTLTLWILTLMPLTLALCNFIIGRLTDSVGVVASYKVPAGLMILNIAALFFYLKRE